SLLIARGFEVRILEPFRQVATILHNQLHQQERHVSDRIGRAKIGIELDTINDDQIVWWRRSRKQVNVIQPEITVSVARYTPSRAILHGGPEPGERVLGQLSEPFEHALAHRRPDLSGRLIEVLSGVPRDHVKAPGARDLLVPKGGAMEGSDPAGEP